MRVEVVSDVVCPWCYIGKRRFERALTHLASEGVTLDLQVRYRAYQLDPTAPLSSSTSRAAPVREGYAKKFGGLQRADDILANVTAIAAKEGITFHMNRALRANTMRAHRLLKLVERDAPELQAAVNESIMQAYFTEGKDIADVDTLIACASRAAYDSPAIEQHLVSNDPADTVALAVADDLQWAADHDITAVPTFMINGSFAVPGAQDTETFVRLLRKIANE